MEMPEKNIHLCLIHTNSLAHIHVHTHTHTHTPMQTCQMCVRNCRWLSDGINRASLTCLFTSKSHRRAYPYTHVPENLIMLPVSHGLQKLREIQNIARVSFRNKNVRKLRLFGCSCNLPINLWLWSYSYSIRSFILSKQVTVHVFLINSFKELISLVHEAY